MWRGNRGPCDPRDFYRPFRHSKPGGSGPLWKKPQMRVCPEGRGEPPWTEEYPDGTVLINTVYCLSCPMHQPQRHPVTGEETGEVCVHDWPELSADLERTHREFQQKLRENEERAREIEEEQRRQERWVNEELPRLDAEAHEVGLQRAAKSEEESNRDHRRRMRVDDWINGLREYPRDEEE